MAHSNKDLKEESMIEEGKPKLDYKDYLEGTKKVLEKSKLEREKYTVMIMDKEFVVYPNVFSPKYFRDTELFAENFPVNNNEEMLEIGSGTGIISIIAIEKGARKVVATDINSDAIKNSQENIEKYQMQDRIEVRQGDVYSVIKPEEKFDTIFWNTPFGLTDEENIPDLEKSVYDPGYKSTEKFIRQARNHLKEKGRILIGFSSTLGKLDLIKKYCEESDFSLKLLYEVDSEETHPVKFEIFEARPINE